MMMSSTKLLVINDNDSGDKSTLFLGPAAAGGRQRLRRNKRWNLRSCVGGCGEEESYEEIYARFNDNAERLESERRYLEIERAKALRMRR